MSPRIPALPHLFSLQGRVAIVTGASSGLGVGFATGLAEAGADVVLGARRADRLERTREEVERLGRRAVCVTTDVSRQTDCQHLVDVAMQEFGRVDVLVNNAGVATAHPATRETVEQFTDVIDVNLNGCYQYAPGYLDHVLERVPLGRQGESDELTAALLLLASPAGGYINGHNLVVDGGFVHA